MDHYQKANKELWTGRISNENLYLHEKIKCVDLEHTSLTCSNEKSFALLGYACDEGVNRNKGRIGAKNGPDAIRKMLSSLSNHFSDKTDILDVGNITCDTENLEETQLETAKCIASILDKKAFPIVLGGGHDLAYAHYNGIKKCFPNKTIGIINLDAHFDLRTIEDSGNSGTPFDQIAKESNTFKYLCLGIQKASNHRKLFEKAERLNVKYLFNTDFTIQNHKKVSKTVNDFITSANLIYLTIDLDGFSSAIAPGVSAPSPLGFSMDIATKVIDQICASKKLISVDLVELNPRFDIDNCTSRLASRLIYQIIETLQSL